MIGLIRNKHRMKIRHKTILFTGGIGFELVRQLTEQGNKVLICGRRQVKLDQAKYLIPGLLTFVCDESALQQCEALASQI